MDKTKSKFINKSTVTFAILAATLSIAAILVSQQASAQTSSAAPAIKGSVSISNATNAFVKANVKVDFNTAANTAKGQVANGTVIGGRLSEVQGYLAYTFTVASYDSNTAKIVIVDAGNGQVLYTSTDMPLYNGGIGGCHHGGFGGNGWGNHRGTTNGTVSNFSPSGSNI